MSSATSAERSRPRGSRSRPRNVEYGPAQVEVNLGHGPAHRRRRRDDGVQVRRQAGRAPSTACGRPSCPSRSWARRERPAHPPEPAGQDGKNAFAVHDADPPVHSQLMRRYLSGLVAHQKELQAVMCPTINAYKRVEDYSFAPTQVSWGLDHRLVGVRSVVEHGEATRLEARWASADANPYLVLAGCLGAGADGLEREIELPPMVSGDPHVGRCVRAAARVSRPRLENLADSEFAREVYGDVFMNTYLAMLRHEVERVRPPGHRMGARALPGSHVGAGSIPGPNGSRDDRDHTAPAERSAVPDPPSRRGNRRCRATARAPGRRRSACSAPVTAAARWRGISPCSASRSPSARSSAASSRLSRRRAASSSSARRSPASDGTRVSSARSTRPSPART